MKRNIILFGLLLCVILIFIVIFDHNNVKFAFTRTVSNDMNYTFNESYSQISDSMIASWDSLFEASEIDKNPFAIMMFFIEFFSELHYENSAGYFSLKEILSVKKSNVKSNAIATCAIMQKLGWDIQCFYNQKECYLGIHFHENWNIRRGHWVEKEGRHYYLKEFNDYSPVGALKLDKPALKYQSLESKSIALKPFPLINSLPKFNNDFFRKRLQWIYQAKNYTVTIRIPEEQIKWTDNLPPSLFGMTASGIEELQNVGLVDKLRFLLDELDEYEKVNFLLKLCQSESSFIYDNQQPIKSVSKQLHEGRNDCDDRSVILYCLLSTVLEYSDSDIVFISWPNHLALGLKPKTFEAEDILKRNGFYVGDKYYILDAAYIGDTYWGSKMERLSNECEIIK